MYRWIGSIVFLGGVWLANAGSLDAQTSRCANCHIANPQADPAPQHLAEWEVSPHARHDVGCEKCHGGDATSFESFLAHRGITMSPNPSSPTHRRNLPRTCGTCHVGAFVEFQKSRHFELLAEERGEGEGPTCSTCHGTVAASLLAPARLERQCATCHGDEGVFPQPDFAIAGRVLLAEVGNVRALLQPVPELIRRVEDAERRRELEEAYEQAQVPLTEAVHSAHAFVFDQMRERLATAKERAEILLNDLANPE